MMTATNTRQEARGVLTCKWGKAATITLVYFLISFVFNYIDTKFEDTFIGFIISILLIIYNLAVGFGLTITFIKLKRNEEDIKCYGFLTNFLYNLKRAFFIGLHILGKMIVPIILMIVAIICIAVSLGSSIMYSFSGSFSPESISALLIFGVILLFVSVVYGVIKELLYSLSYYIAYDNPEMSNKDVVNESARLMKGNRGNLFVLELSFIGWAILGICTLGIGYLWLVPYIQVALVCFYEELTQK